MKQCIFFCICCVSFFTARLQAQQNHFIYLQTENKQPFYVKLDNNIFSSSLSGYLILSRLPAGTYNLVLGFPKKEWAEQKFFCEVANRDAGYLVKNFGEKGWGLFNLQTLDITMSGAQNQQPVAKVEEKTDEFSTLLSSAVNDPSILKKEVSQPVGVKNDTANPAPDKGSVQPDIPAIKEVAAGETKTVAIPGNVVSKNTLQELMAPAAASERNEEIRKILESTELEQISRTYLVTSDGVTDTVRVTIPVGADRKSVTEQNPVSNMVMVEEVSKAQAAENPKAKEEKQPGKEKFLPIDMTPVPVTGAVSLAETTVPSPVIPVAKDALVAGERPALSLVNSDCINNASDEDFLKLRKKMASASSDEDMMSIARKAFKQKCFSTDQIKNLGVLFLNDEGRYSFFDAAYPHVWDSSNYKLLENQLADPYYANRFKAMIRH